MLRSVFALAGSIILFINLSACSKENSRQENASAVIKMQAVNFEQWQRALHSFRPATVVVDAWATWCDSCIERFPYMVELHEKYEGQNVQFVSLNLDDRNAAEELQLAEQFLNKMNAYFPHYTMDENMIQAFEKLNFISIPVVLIYDGDGVERFRFSGDNPNKQFTDQDVELAVQELLKESV